MIFNELYSVYYNTVAKIIEAAFNPEATEKDLQRCVIEEAFSESVLTILPALKSGKWPLLNEEFSPALLHKPTMPLTNLEKRWLKAISEDPRVKLFGVELPELDGVDPLFTRDDYLGWDYSDPETAVVGVAFHAFEWLFVRLAPVVLIGAVVGIVLVWKKM